MRWGGTSGHAGGADASGRKLLRLLKPRAPRLCRCNGPTDLVPRALGTPSPGTLASRQRDSHKSRISVAPAPTAPARAHGSRPGHAHQQAGNGPVQERARRRPAWKSGPTPHVPPRTSHVRSQLRVCAGRLRGSVQHQAFPGPIEPPPGARRQPEADEVERSDLHAEQPQGGQADRSGHPAHLAVAAFGQLKGNP